MKPFDLERAKAGDPVVTRNGLKIKLVEFNKPGDYPIIGFDIEHGSTFTFTYKGQVHDYRTSERDLFMAPKKVQHWANVYRIVSTGAIDIGDIWTSEAKAIENIDENIDIKKYIKTILLHEEEI